MLDLATLGLSMSMQDELPKIRNEAGTDNVFQSNQEAVPEQETVLSTAASAVESVISTVESAASAVADALTPSASSCVAAVEACAVEAPTVDLSLPTAPCAAK